jgi:hypothetical protein
MCCSGTRFVASDYCAVPGLALTWINLRPRRYLVFFANKSSHVVALERQSPFFRMSQQFSVSSPNLNVTLSLFRTLLPFASMSLLPIKRAFALMSMPFFFVSLVVSVSVPAKILSQHCLHEAVLLSANLACSVTGVGDLLSPIGQYMQPIYVDSYSENSGNPRVSLWSYEPVCTEIIEGIGSKLCVYTNITFSGGRGISIFTTPQIAEEFAALPLFRDLTALDGINSSDGPWYTQKLPGKGTGVLAELDLERGDLVTAYTPLLLVHRENLLSTRKREKFLRIAVDQLPFATRELYLSLATTFGDPTLIVQDIVNTNAYDIEVGGQMHVAVFPETSRINHDCAPKYVYIFMLSANC